MRLSVNLLRAVCLGCSALALSSCGGGSGPQAAGTGRFQLTVQWPPPGRLIPAASASIQIVLKRGDTVLGQQVLRRPQQPPWNTTASFDRVQPGSITVFATAYPNSDATGVAQATGTVNASIAPDRLSQVTVTMDSTIATLEVTPANATVLPGGTTQLAATPKDGAGNVVLVAPGNITWSSATPATATVSASGLVTGVAASTSPVTITATESESHKSGSGNVTVNTAAFTPKQIVYALTVSQTGFRSISQFEIDAQGKLTPLSPVMVPNSDNATQVGVNPNQQFVYIYRPNDNLIAQYSVAQNGTLQPLTPPTVAVPRQLFNGNGYVAVDPRGRTLYLSHQSTNLLALYHINADGTLTAFAQPTVAVGQNGGNFGMAIDKNGNNLYVVHAAQSGTRSVEHLTIAADGSLVQGASTDLNTPVGDIWPAEGIELHPNGQFAYVVQRGISDPNTQKEYNLVHQYSFAANGDLTPLNPPTVRVDQFPYGGGNAIPGDASVDPTGHFIYYGDYNGGLASQVINADGTLGSLVVDVIPSPGMNGFGRPAFNPAGGFGLVGGSTFGSTTAVQFHVNPDGTLTQLQPVDFGSTEPFGYPPQQGFVNRR